MAETNRSAPTPARLLDLRDALDQEARQLRAQLLVTYGTCGPDFRRLADDQQDAFMEGAGDRAARIQQLLVDLGEALRVRGAA